ncbi:MULTISPECIES: TetR-like C-terminal domain-containing protein [Nocardiopsis]|uniref:TetR family transcriptional regulator n=1 Tax=Nocardiopsis sinuspersici TaxID=501010 RepID=A0A1V3BXN6_9ACTN|nr:MULTISPECIES: TetR-like C-terminal domain-containing protein [Nocardiopsis]OOC53327.1 TetR family transcriptional regulator [Nocardiopsis sinuspersici]
MSPRKADPGLRTALVDVAARILASEGPRALTTRRVAHETGHSTMAVYTNFDGMAGLVRAMVHEGFARLHENFSRVWATADPVSDLATFGRAYRASALAEPHLYAVMFGTSSLAGFSLTEDDRQHGRYTMTGVIECVERCMAADRFRHTDPVTVAHHMWSSVHGLASLELGAYLVEPYGPDTCFETQLSALMVGAGDSPESADRSVAASRRTFAAAFTSSAPLPGDGERIRGTSAVREVPGSR